MQALILHSGYYPRSRRSISFVLASQHTRRQVNTILPYEILKVSKELIAANQKEQIYKRLQTVTET